MEVFSGSDEEVPCGWMVSGKQQQGVDAAHVVKEPCQTVSVA